MTTDDEDDVTMDVGVIVGLVFVSLLSPSSSSSSSNDYNVDPYVRQLVTYFQDEQHDAVVYLNSPTVLRCPVTVTPGDKEVSVRWRKDGRVIENRTGRWILPDGSLHLEALGLEAEDGVYECSVQHRIGTMTGPRMHLRELELPEFSGDIQDVGAVLGESARLECVADGTPDPVITWLKGDHLLSIDVSRMDAFSGVLHIGELTEQDEGSYECSATNIAGETKSQKVRLTINNTTNHHVAPMLLSGPRNQSALVFDRVVLECLLTGRPRPVVTWTKEDEAAFELSGHIRVTRLGNLEISSVQLSDSGIYVCSWIGADGSGSWSSAQARLTVLAPPRLVPGEGMEWLVQRRQRHMVRLRCKFDGVPPPEVAWLKNGKVVESNGRMRIGAWELVISSSDITDSGFYQCRGVNSVGAAQTATWVDIEMNESAPLPPVDLEAFPLNSTSIRLTWSDHPSTRNRTIIGYSIHSFRTEGHLSFHQHEKKEKQVVLNKKGDTNSSLDHTGLEPFTNYTFYVVAYTGVAWSDYSAFVTAVTHQDVPRGSPLAEVVTLGASALRVRWSELSQSAARGIVIQYKVLSRLHGNSSYQQNLFNADIREFVIQGLHPETEYDIAVIAATKIGFLPLDSALWMTVTTEAVGNIRVLDCLAMNVSLLSSSRLLVSWRPTNTSRPIGFRLTIQKTSQHHHTPDENQFTKFIIDLDSSAENNIFTQLEVLAGYQVSLASQSESGQDCSITKTFKVEPLPNGDGSRSNLPAPPAKISAKAVNGSAIHVQWEKPPSAEPIARYTVRYRRDNSEATDVSVVKLITSPTETIVIGGLMAYTLYDLSVQTHTDIATGHFSSTVVRCRTEEGVPSKPLNVRLALYSSTAVQVSWDPPANKNGLIQNYVVYYSDDGSKMLSKWNSKMSGGSSLSSLVSHLAPDTFFYFCLKATTAVGVGTSSDVVCVQTQELPGGYAKQDVTNETSAGALSDLDLGIIIGTAIGVTCIILCVVIIVIRDRRCASSAVPSNRNLVGNGAVRSCRCHLGNCSGVEVPREPWQGVDATDEEDFPSVNSVLVENENCDTKGGYMNGGRGVKIPLHVVASNTQATPLDNRLHVSDMDNNTPSIPTSVENQTSGRVQNVVPGDDARSEHALDMEPERRLLSMQSPSDVTSQPDGDVAGGEPVNRPNAQGDVECDGETDPNAGPLRRDGAKELELADSLLGNSCRADANHTASALHSGVGGNGKSGEERSLREGSGVEDLRV